MSATSQLANVQSDFTRRSPLLPKAAAGQNADRLLRTEPGALELLAADASDWFRAKGLAIPQVTMVKDYWVTEVLRCLSEPLVATRADSNVPAVHARAVFKGGTSLSKAHNLLHRFSEDVDVYLDAYEVSATGGVVPTGRNVGAGRVDGLMKAAAERIKTKLGMEYTEFEFQRTGSKRGYIFDYGAAPSTEPADDRALKEGVQLELVRMGHPTPSTRLQVSSLIAQFAAETGRFALADFDDAAPVSIDVLSPERTLVDKLCILHDKAIQVMQTKGSYELRRHARHYYDVHQLLKARFIIQNLRANPTMVATYAEEAAEDSARNRRPGEPRPKRGFGHSPAFRNKDVLEHARKAYDQEMVGLGYGEMPSFDDVIGVVRSCSTLL